MGVAMPNDKRHTVEGYWDCQYCGRTGIKGRFVSCPGCSHARDKSLRFYIRESDEAHAISREEFERQKAEASKNSRSESANYTTAHEVTGPSLYGRKAGEGRGDEHDSADTSDWYCDYCDSYNPAAAKFCSNCGAAREQSSGTTYADTMGTVARTYDSRGNLVSERDLSKKATAKPEPKPQAEAKSSPFGLLKIVAIVLGALLVIGGIVTCVRPSTKKIEVAGFDWQRNIAIEQLQTVKDDDWELPDGARLLRKSEEVRDYRQVVDHYEEVEHEVPHEVLDHYETYTTEVDNGDGTFDVEQHKEPVYVTEYRTETRREPVYRNVPIYDTKYYFEIERWVHERDVTTSGEGREPYWGDVELSGPSGEHGTGEEREGDRTGEYGVTDTDGSHYLADEDFWNSLEVGQKLEVRLSGDHISPKE
jgi:hypothetical protein